MSNLAEVYDFSLFEDRNAVISDEIMEAPARRNAGRASAAQTQTRPRTQRAQPQTRQGSQRAQTQRRPRAAQAQPKTEVKRSRRSQSRGQTVRETRVAMPAPERRNRPARPAKPQERPERSSRQKTRENIITPSREDYDKSRRVKPNLPKLISRGACFVAVLVLMFCIINGQVQLAELTENFNVQTQSLQEANSEKMYLEAQNAQRVDPDEIESYAVEKLGMKKLNESQVYYVNLAQEDKGVVLGNDSISPISSALNTIKSWFA